MAKNTPRKKRTPSKQTRFEMRIRAEVDLNVTCRVLWLLTALSHDGHTSLSQAAMAEQLRTTPEQIQRSLKLICAIRPNLFRQVKVKGIHRPDQYQRCYLKGESPEDFVYRALRWDKMDTCLGLHWAACINYWIDCSNLGKEPDGTTKPDGTTFSARQLWSVSYQALRLARRKMNELGHFRVASTREAGKPATYIPNYDRVGQPREDAPIKQRVEQSVEPVRSVEPVTAKTTASVAKQKKIEEQRIERERLAGEQEERRRMAAEKHQKELAAAAGVNMEGVTARSITASTNKPVKRIIKAWDWTQPSKAKVDENDL